MRIRRVHKLDLMGYIEYSYLLVSKLFEFTFE